MNVVTRAQAKASGLKHYFTGKPCSSGHVSARSTGIGACLECDRLRQASKRAENPDANKEMQRARRAADPEKYRLQNREWAAKNPERMRAKWTRRRLKHGEVLAAAAKAWRRLNPERAKSTVKQWHARNPDRMRFYSSTRRARCASAVPAWFGEFDAFVWSEAQELAVMREECTGIIWHCDHMIPLAARKASGLHVAGNCQVIPARQNLSKKNRMIFTEPREWLKAL
jgi:hypothetical protein